MDERVLGSDQAHDGDLLPAYRDADRHRIADQEYRDGQQKADDLLRHRGEDHKEDRVLQRDLKGAVLEEQVLVILKSHKGRRRQRRVIAERIIDHLEHRNYQNKHKHNECRGDKNADRLFIP